MKALVVDDNADNRYLLKVLLKSRGHEAVSAENGVEAIERLRQGHVDLIISDILMPKMDGYRLCRECKLDEGLRDIPFIFYSATYADEKDEAFALALGANAFVRKPIDSKPLMDLVERVVAEHRAGRSPSRPMALKEEARYLAEYAQRVVNKLEEKVSDLEREIAARKQAEHALQEREERLRLIAETIDDVFWISTPGAKEILYVSPAYERLWERSCESLYHAPLSFLDAVHPDDRPGLAHILELHTQGKPYETEYRIVRRNGAVRWMRERGFPTRGADGHLRAMTGVVSDITERKLLEQELEQQARTDSLTGAANRRHFLALAESGIGLSRRYHHPLSLLMLDIDHFKAINDTHGHHAGDLVLKELVQTSQKALRDVDILGRIGGEEFAILLPETDADRALQVAERLRQAISAAEVSLGVGVAVRFMVSIGVATLGNSDANIDAFLGRADGALYQAKQSGRNRVCAA